MARTQPEVPYPGLIQLGKKLSIPRYLASIWERREFAGAIAMSELRAQNMDTVLGNLWHLLNPLFLIGVYYVIFDVILGVGQRGGTDNYIAFLSIGIFVFYYTQKSITAGARSLIANIDLMRSIRFPRATLPCAAVVGETAVLLPAILITFVVVLGTGEPLHPSWLSVFPALVLQALFNFGAALFIARLTDHFHDVQNLLPYLLRIWLYLSGVLYAVEGFIHDPTALAVFRSNPAYIYISLVREPLLDQQVAPATLWWVAALWGLLTLIVGFFFFRAREQEYGRG